MGVSDSFRAFVLEQLGQVASVSDRRMFGGVGIYADELFFAIIDDNTLYFKVDESNRGDFDEAGMPAFQPYGPGGGAMNYCQVPADVLEDADRLRIWAAKAINVARQGKNKKKTRS